MRRLFFKWIILPIFIFLFLVAMLRIYFGDRVSDKVRYFFSEFTKSPHTKPEIIDDFKKWLKEELKRRGSEDIENVYYGKYEKDQMEYNILTFKSDKNTIEKIEINKLGTEEYKVGFHYVWIGGGKPTVSPLIFHNSKSIHTKTGWRTPIPDDFKDLTMNRTYIWREYN